MRNALGWNAWGMQCVAMMQKCPYSQFFWSAFTQIRTEEQDLQSVSLYSVRMLENKDQKNSEYRQFLCRVSISSSIFFAYRSHINLLFYLVLVFTALRILTIFFENLTNLLQNFLSMLMSMCDVKWVQPRPPPSLQIFLYCCYKSLSSIGQLK